MKKPKKYDWGNLKSLLNYLKGKKHMKLKFKVGSMSMVRWWIDAYFNTHEDCKCNTGSMMSLDKGEVESYPKKNRMQ